jgi:hypothetical protein
VESGLSLHTRRELLQHMASQHCQASSTKKSLLLDEFTATTGYNRMCAMWLCNHAEEVQQTLPHPRLRKSGSEVQQALFLAWNAANRICAKRLIPFLPTLIEAFERHEHFHITAVCRGQLLSISAATADRLLHSQRTLGRRGTSPHVCGPRFCTTASSMICSWCIEERPIQCV